MNDLPEDRRWAAVLLLCGNLGLGGSWDGSRRLLARLAEQVMPGAVLVAAALVDGTGWRIELHVEDGEDHAVLLRST